MITWYIEGLRNKQWVVLFHGIENSTIARAQIRRLRERNPSCVYRVRFSSSGTPISEKRP